MERDNPTEKRFKSAHPLMLNAQDFGRILGRLVRRADRLDPNRVSFNFGMVEFIPDVEPTPPVRDYADVTDEKTVASTIPRIYQASPSDTPLPTGLMYTETRAPQENLPEGIIDIASHPRHVLFKRVG